MPTSIMIHADACRVLINNLADRAVNINRPVLRHCAIQCTLYGVWWQQTTHKRSARLSLLCVVYCLTHWPHSALSATRPSYFDARRRRFGIRSL